MEREFKGSSVKEFLTDYCVIDLETTSIYLYSAEILEISALKIRNGELVDTFSTLVNPHCHIPASATAINHITDNMVQNAPDFKEVVPVFLQFISDDVLVGYNNAAYDMNLLYDKLLMLCDVALCNNYIDVLHCAQRCPLDLPNCKLESLSKYYNLDTSGEHRALKDCYLTKACYERLYQEFGDAMFSAACTRRGGAGQHNRFSSSTIALQELQGMLEKIIEDGKVSLLEFSELQEWIENHRDLQGNYPFDRVFFALDHVLADGRVDEGELEELQILFSEFADPVSSRSCEMDIASIKGKHICITGDFEAGKREQVYDLIIQVGGIIDQSVKKSTDYLVVGSLGSQSWKTGKYGGKIQKAIEMMDKGADIQIVEEYEFIPKVREMAQNKEVSEVIVDARDNYNWVEAVRTMLDDLIAKEELPAGSLYLSENVSKADAAKKTYSVCIWEPSYPPLPDEKRGVNRLVLSIFPSTAKNRPDDLDLNIRENQEGDLREKLPEDAIVLPKSKSDISTGMQKIRFNKFSPSLVEYIKENTIYCIGGYKTKADMFGCCSHFIECSDAKKCVHPNKLYSRACWYRIKLEQGRILYGKNRNV